MPWLLMMQPLCAGDIANWEVSAVPGLHDSGQTNLVTAYYYRNGQPHLVATYDQKTGAEGSTRLPAIRIQVEFEFSSNEMLPSLWPWASEMELLRSTDPKGGYQVVGSWSERDLRKLRVPEPPAFIGMPSGKKFLFALLDAKVETGVKLYYKLRFLNGDGKTLAESGYCSSMAMPFPVMQSSVDKDGFPNLKWEDCAFKPTGLLSEPKIVISDRIQEFARLPVKGGGFKIPIRITSPIGQRPSFTFSMEEFLWKDAWNVQGGQRRLRARDRVEMNANVEIPPPPPSPGKAPYERRNSILVESRQPESYHPAGARFVAYPDAPLGQGGVWEHAGLAELCVRTMERKKLDDGTPVTAHYSFVRNPLPTGLKAISGDGHVDLRWNPIERKKEDWVEGPWFVLKRWNQDVADIRQNRFDDSNGEVILVADDDKTEFVDRDVQNGKVYYYALEIEGVSRATSWTEDVGEYACLVPVKVRMPYGYSGFPVIATPEKKHPLRIALLSDSNADPRINAAQTYFLSELSKYPSLELIERTVTPELFEESQLGDLNTASRKDSNASSVRPADVIIRLAERRVGRGRNLDVWIEDFKNGIRKRAASVLLDDLNRERVLRVIYETIKKEKSELLDQGGVTATPATVSQPTVAVLGVIPLAEEGGSAIPQAGFEDLLTAAISKVKGVRVVDREQIRKVLKEIGGGGAVDDRTAARAGHLLKADVVLCGFYSMQDKHISLSLRLIEAKTGKLMKVFEKEVSLDQTNDLGLELAGAINGCSFAVGTEDSHPILGWIESRMYQSGRDRLWAMKTSAFLSPSTPEYHFEIGHQYSTRGEHELALANFSNGLALAEQMEDPWRFYIAVASELRALKKSEEEVELWKRAILDREKRGLDLGRALLQLARIQKDMGKKEDAVATLKRIKETTYEDTLIRAEQWLPVVPRLNHTSYEAGKIYEELGCLPEALEAYSKCVWCPPSHSTWHEPAPSWRERTRLGPGYAAMIRLLKQRPRSDRPVILHAIAQCLENRRPQQAFMALSEAGAMDSGDPHELSRLVKVAENAGKPEIALRCLEKIGGRDAQTMESMRILHKLATLHRHLGHEKVSEDFSRKIIAMKMEGGEADQLRDVARARLDPIADPYKKYLTPWTVPAELKHEIGSLGDGFSYAVIPNGMLECTDSSSKKTVWLYDMHPRRQYKDYMGRGSYMASTTMACAANDRPIDLLGKSVTLDGDRIFVPDLIDGVLHALDRKTGKLLWKFVDWSPISEPLVFDNQVLVGNSMGEVTALSIETGEVVKQVFQPLDHEEIYDEDIQLMQLRVQSNINLKTSKRYMINQLIFGSYLDNEIIGGINGSRPSPPESRVKSNPWRTGVGLYLKHLVSLPDFGLRNIIDTHPPPAVEQNADALLGILQDKSAQGKVFEARSNALAKLQSTPGRERAVPILAQIATDRAEIASLRAEALRLIGEIVGKPALPRLAGFLDDPSPAVRLVAVDALGGSGNRFYIKDLEPRLKDPDRKVVEQTIRAMINLAGLETRPLFTSILNDSTSPNRSVAAMKLLELGDAESCQIVKSLFSWMEYKENMGMNRTAFVLLCGAGDPEALAELERLLEAESAASARSIEIHQITAKRQFTHDEYQRWSEASKDARVPGEVLVSLAPITADKRLMPILLKVLERPGSGHHLREAAEILARIGDPSAVPSIMARLQQPSSNQDAEMLSKALEALTGQTQGNDPAQWDIWWRREGKAAWEYENPSPAKSGK